MNADSIEYIRLLANLSFVIPLLFYLSRLGQVPVQHHIIGALIIISASTDLVSYFKIFQVPVLYNIFTILEFSLVTAFYYRLVYRKRGSLVMLISIGVFISVILFCFFKYNRSENYTILWSLESFIFLIHGFMYTFNIQAMSMDRYFDRNLLSNIIFNVTFFFYATVTFLIFALSDTIFRHHDLETIKAFWAFHNIFAIIKNLGFAVAIFYTGKREIYMTLEQLEKIAKKFKEEGQPH